MTQDKDSHLEHGKNAGRTERRDLVVRLYRDAAVVTGPQIILVERDGESEVVVASLQVWTHADGSWRLAAFTSPGQLAR